MDNNATDWFTSNGQHIPIRGGESKGEALRNFTENHNIKYMRFGDIPKSGKSINHYTGGNEEGVSVFELDKAGKPVLHNLQEANTLSTFISPNYEDRPQIGVTGKVVGTGNDGEPLIGNAKRVSYSGLSKEEIRDHIVQHLENSFTTSVEDKFSNANSLSEIHSFYVNDENFMEPQFYKGSFDEWANQNGIRNQKVVSYNGRLYANPKEGYDTKTGYRGK